LRFKKTYIAKFLIAIISLKVKGTLRLFTYLGSFSHVAWITLDISKIETGRDSKMVKLDFTPMRDE